MIHQGVILITRCPVHQLNGDGQKNGFMAWPGQFTDQLIIIRNPVHSSRRGSGIWEQCLENDLREHYYLWGNESWRRWS